MWHIVLIGYIFVTLMFSIAQPSLARILIYLVFWTILPVSFAMWVALVRRRNRLMKIAESQPSPAPSSDESSINTPSESNTSK